MTLGTDGFFGDYNRMACSGLKLHIPHSVKDIDGWNVYLNRVDLLPCPIAADLNADGVADATDASLFTSAYAAGDPLADVDRDGTLSTADATKFCASYACGCNP